MDKAMDAALEALAKDITARLAAQVEATTVVVEVKASAILSLGFDAGQKVTADDLRRALAENFVEVVQLTIEENAMIGHATILEVTPTRDLAVTAAP